MAQLDEITPGQRVFIDTAAPQRTEVEIKEITGPHDSTFGDGQFYLVNCLYLDRANDTVSVDLDDIHLTRS